MPSRSFAGVVPNAVATTSRYATWAGCSSSQYSSVDQLLSRHRSRNTECWPEHMWRISPGRSPSRASRAAVSESSGMPSMPVASAAWLTPVRRYIAWSVRTWRSSPEWLLAMIASSGGSRLNSFSPPASRIAVTPNGFTHERRFTR